MTETQTTDGQINFREHDYGAYVYVPTTLRVLERAGVVLDSSFGCDQAEHAELLDDPTILRIAVTTTHEDSADGTCSRFAEVECFDRALGGDAGWHRATPLPTEMVGNRGCGYGESGLREANRLLAGASCELVKIARENTEAEAILRRIEDECETWWREEFGDDDECETWWREEFGDDEGA